MEDKLVFAETEKKGDALPFLAALLLQMALKQQKNGQSAVAEDKRAQDDK